MFSTLFSLEWKNFWRAANIGKSIFIRFLFLFLFLYFGIIIIFLSSISYVILQKQMPEQDPFEVFNTLLFYYFGFEFMIRFFFQKIPILKLKPLLVQNISRRTLVHFILSKSIFSIFNVLPIFAFTPFAITLIVNDYPFSTVIPWWVGVVLCSFLLNFVVLYIQKILAKTHLSLLIILAIYGLVFLLQYYNFIDIPAFFGSFFNAFASHPFLDVLLVFLILGMYGVNFYHYKKELYIEENTNQSAENFNSMDYGWLSYFGEYSTYLQNDIRLILRNKRLKNSLYMSGFMLFYGLIFVFQDTYTSNYNMKMGMFYFLGIFMSGMFAMNFGQFIPTVDSSSYGLFSTLPFSTEKYLTSKTILMATSVILISPFIFLYYFIDSDIILPFSVGVFSNLGLSIPILLLFSSMNRRYLDLTKSPMMNYQGVGWQQFVAVFGILFLSLGLYAFFTYLTTPTYSLLILLCISIVGIASIRLTIKKVAKAYHNSKYKRLEGFKQN